MTNESILRTATLKKLQAFKERTYSYIISLKNNYNVERNINEPEETIKNEISLKLSKYLSDLETIFNKTTITIYERSCGYDFDFDSLFKIDSYLFHVDSKTFLYCLSLYEKKIFHICSSIIELFETPNNITDAFNSIIKELTLITLEYVFNEKTPD